MEEEKIRVSNVSSNCDGFDLNEEIRVSSECDLGKNEIRVSNETSNCVDLNLNEEIGVSSECDLRESEIRVSDESSNCVGLNLNEVVSVSSERDLEESEIMVLSQDRVSNESNSDVLDLNLHEEVRVSSEYESGKSEIDDIRVLPEERGEDSGEFGEVDKVRVLSTSYGIGENGEIVIKGENLELKNAELGINEIRKPKTLGSSGVVESREVENGDNDMGNNEASGSGRNKILDLSSCNDFGGEGESEVKREGVLKGEGPNMVCRDGDLSAPMNTKIFGIGTDDSVMRSLSAKVLGTEFEMGDMVWGKVKSHPWWPGYLYNEAFALSSVRRTRSDGHILVAFFGDSSYGWFDPDDLIPYDPHYAEKSQQVSSRNFIRAVEDSADETSRRSALGLSCYCRNPNNFRITNVPGFLTVDIVDFEPSGVYSLNQIQKARDSFRPAETLSFVHQLATDPTGSDCKNLDFVKNNAVTLAYRRAVFEKFDETYGEAFGDKPQRPELPQSSIVKDQSRAPLSGPLVYADTLRVRKGSTKATKPNDQSKKDRYLLKRRDESNDLRISAITQVHASPSSSTNEDGTSSGGYVFQKRDQAGESAAVNQLTTSAYAVTAEDKISTGHILAPVPLHSEGDEEGTADFGDMQRVPDKTISVVARSNGGNLATSGSLLKKNKAAKRPASELRTEKSEAHEKKKVKKLNKAGNCKSSEHLDMHSAISGGLSPVNPAVRPTQVVASIRDNHTTQAGPWESDTELGQILTYLHGLALNPFHVMEKNGPAFALQFLLKFRSLVFLKSSCVSDLVPEASHKPAIESTKSAMSSLNSLKVSSSKQNGLVKGGRKRPPSERQEENAAKRAKKVTDIKSLSSENRALLKNPELQQAQRPQVKPVKKAERPARVKEPTFLVMRFQSGSTLPSLVELKARFARFGPLDTSLIRVFYKTNTCRVAFLFKQDAHVAYRYAVGSKTLFSNVSFMLKPVAGPEPQQSTGGKTEDMNSDSSARPPTLAALPLKSCLKKSPDGDEPGGPSNGGGSSRLPRVRFNVGEEKGSGSNRGGLQVQLMEGAPSSSSSSVATDVNNNQRLLSSLPLQAPLLPFPQFVRPLINHQLYHTKTGPSDDFVENPTATTTSTSLPPPTPLNADISKKMMSLLTKCHDVVTNVKSALGYVPYHPL